MPPRSRRDYLRLDILSAGPSSAAAPKLEGKAHRAKRQQLGKKFSFASFYPFTPDTSCLTLSKHFIRSRQDVRLDRQADLLRGLEIDHQLELRGPLYGQIGRLGAFQNLVHVNGNASIHKDVVCSI